MIWNWQQPDWPVFTDSKARFDELEAQFLRQSGVLLGSYRHVRDDDKAVLAIELMSDEALKTSEIEGEILNRDSVHSSIRRHFGLDPGPGKVSPAEKGIADMMVELYRNPVAPLTQEALFSWHTMIMAGRPMSPILAVTAPTVSPCKLSPDRATSERYISKHRPRKASSAK